MFNFKIINKSKLLLYFMTIIAFVGIGENCYAIKINKIPFIIKNKIEQNNKKFISNNFSMKFKIFSAVAVVAIVAYAGFLCWKIKHKDYGSKIDRDLNDKINIMKNGSIEQMREVLAKDTYGIIKESIEFNILPYVLKNRDFEKLGFLLNQIDDKTVSCFIFTEVKNKNLDIVRWLMEEKIIDPIKKMDFKTQSCIISAAVKNGDLEFVKWLIEEKNIDLKNIGKNLIKTANSNGKKELEKFLFSKIVNE